MIREIIQILRARGWPPAPESTLSRCVPPPPVLPGYREGPQRVPFIISVGPTDQACGSAGQRLELGAWWGQAQGQCSRGQSYERQMTVDIWGWCVYYHKK